MIVPSGGKAAASVRPVRKTKSPICGHDGTSKSKRVNVGARGVACEGHRDAEDCQGESEGGEEDSEPRNDRGTIFHSARRPGGKKPAGKPEEVANGPHVRGRGHTSWNDSVPYPKRDTDHIEGARDDAESDDQERTTLRSFSPASVLVEEVHITCCLRSSRY